MDTTASSRHNRHLWQLPYAILLFIIAALITYPYYRYYIDPDAVGYLTIAKRYATGDYLRAVNGLWSPFHPWLVALGIKNGIDALLTAQLTNALACILVLISTFSLFRRFQIHSAITFAFMTVLPAFLTYCLFKQLFDDVWQIVFLLWYLLLLTSRDFLKKPWKWLLCGFIGALAFYAKTYSLYFIFLHLPVAAYLLSGKDRGNKQSWIIPCVTVMVTMLLWLTPWMFAMHTKYGKWTLSNAGDINQSWTLKGRKTFDPAIKHLIPPPHEDSPCNMEDPYFNEPHYFKPWQSPQLFAAQLLRSTLSVAQGLYIINEMSPFLLSVLIISAYFIFFRKDQQYFNTRHKVLMWAAVIMPLGYVLLHFEARYIWLLGYIGIILGSVWLMALQKYITPPKLWYVLIWIFALSYTSYAFYDMKLLFRKGEDLYMQAQQINKLGLKGSYTSNDKPTRAPMTALLVNCPYYTIEYPDFSRAELLEEMRRYGVRYYFLYHAPHDGPSIKFDDEAGRPFPELTGGNIPGLKIFEIIP